VHEKKLEAGAGEKGKGARNQESKICKILTFAAQKGSYEFQQEEVEGEKKKKNGGFTNWI